MSNARAHKTRRSTAGRPWFGMFAACGLAAGGLAVAHVTVGTPGAAVGTAQATTATAKPATAVHATDFELKVGDQIARMRWDALGGPDAQGRFAVDRAKVLAALEAVRGRFERAPIDAYLDLEARAIHDDTPGIGLDVQATAARIAVAALEGRAQVDASLVDLPARVDKAQLGIDDIGHVLGTYTTKFSVSDKERNFNLKLAASKINGLVLQPGQDFSFNDVVGERSEREGYKVAHVITAGEMVDGLAGGTCQISTTLFAASFFAGLEVVKQSPHSRPSVYAPLGLDATVVWPSTDLKLRNSLPFPIVIHYRVARGESTVEILGAPRPWDKIVFERQVLEQTPFASEERLDDKMPLDQTSLDQEGFPGYRIQRQRKFMKDGEVVKHEKWTVSYKPVTEYIRRGTNPDPNAKMPTVKPSHGPTAPKSSSMTLSQ